MSIMDILFLEKGCEPTMFKEIMPDPSLIEKLEKETAQLESYQKSEKRANKFAEIVEHRRLARKKNESNH